MPCEDAMGAGGNYLFALDGASGLTGVQLMDQGSDAAWFAQGVKTALEAHLGAGDGRPLPALFDAILPGLEEAYVRRAAELGVEVPPDAPSAGIALFREVGDEVEFFGLGDCVGVAQLRDGTVTASCDGNLPALDRGVLRRMEQIHRATGCSVLEARRQCQELLVENRKLRNQPGGYWILDPGGQGVRHARTARWKRRDLQAVAAFSDGFGQLADTFGLYAGYDQLYRAMEATPLKTLVGQLFAAQEADREANAHPRLKFRDDTCALWAQVLE